MMTRPMISEPGFTYQDAANATVKELSEFLPYELAQLLAEAQNAADDADRAAVEAENDMEFARNDPENDEGQREYFVTWAAKRREEAAMNQTTARRAAKRLFKAYGETMGLL